MGLFNFAKPATQVPAPGTNGNLQQPAPAQGQGQTTPAPVTPINATGGQNTDPSNPVTGTMNPAPAEPTTPDNPLDNFASLLSNTPTEPTANPLHTDMVLPTDELAKLAATMDFKPAITDEVKTAIQAGDTEAIATLINSSSQNAYQQAMQHMSVLFNKNLETRLQGLDSVVGNSVKQSLTNTALESNAQPVHPLVQKELARIAGDISKANPNATPQQVADGARKYLESVAANLTSAQTSSTPNTPDNPGMVTTDYSEWMGMN